MYCLTCCENQLEILVLYMYFLSPGLWSVINNAGVCRIGPLDWQSLDELKKMVDVNLWGLVDVSKTFLPLLKSSNGRLVNVASIGGMIIILNMIH